MNYKIYYAGRLLAYNYSEAIGSFIVDNFKKGDIFNLYPFNYDGLMKVSWKQEKLEYHTTLEIQNIKYSITEHFNGSIKTLIEIFLVDAVEEDY